jgi:hypothetical protein
MRDTIVAAVVAAFAFVACGDDRSPGEGGETATLVAISTPTPADLSEEAFPGLIYWSGFLNWETEPTRAQIELVSAAAAAKDPTFLAYLLDLVSIPTPYRDAVLPGLGNWLGAEGDRSLFDWWQEQGPKGPEDDSVWYREFKQRLMATIQLEIGAFLDFEADRLISAQEIQWGGVCVDCIPPLERPGFVTPEEASSWIAPTDPVIGVAIDGDVRAYPTRIIAWHEMVNDLVGGVQVSLAYCTLCQSAILYETTVDGTVFDFGTSGLLYRSNKLMYDRQTRSLWEQWTGEPVWGELVGSGIELDILPVVHTRWSEWLAAHPDTLVLDINTGFERDYGSGVAYGEYFASQDLIFPVPVYEFGLAQKDWVYAVRIDGDTVAFGLIDLAEAGFAVDTVGGTEVVVFATADGIGGRAYEAGGLTFSAYDAESGTASSEDGRTWSLSESALTANDGTELARVPGHNAYWFAVTNHAQMWRLWEPGD